MPKDKINDIAIALNRNNGIYHFYELLCPPINCFLNFEGRQRNQIPKITQTIQAPDNYPKPSISTFYLSKLLTLRLATKILRDNTIRNPATIGKINQSQRILITLSIFEDLGLTSFKFASNYYYFLKKDRIRKTTNKAVKNINTIIIRPELPMNQ